MLRWILAALSGLVPFGGCMPSHDESLPIDQPGSFALKEVESRITPDGMLKTWRATSLSTKGTQFSFRLEMLFTTPKEDEHFAFSKGAIIREPGADGTEFLREVARAIEAKGQEPSKAERLERLDFSTTILGTELSRYGDEDTIGGTFTSTKPGGWIAFKLFLAEGEGEVYLNINPALGQGEFSVKDSDYSEIVLRELAKVFYP